MPILIGVVVVLFIVIMVLGLYLINMKQNVRQMKDDLEMIDTEETNAVIRTSTKDKDLINLAKAINHNIEYVKELRKKIKAEETKIVSTITSLSHDLRTPLTSILGYTQLIMKEDLSNKQNEYIMVIDERIRRLRELVDELYEYSLSYTEHKPKLEKVNVKPLIEETMLLFYNDFTNKKFDVEINIEEDILMITDSSMLKRVFYNIISNALNHGKEFFKVSYDNKKITFTNEVIDTDVIDVEKIFDRFFTVAKSRTNESSGLGLSIAKKIIEDLGGSIKAFLNDNKLSIVVFIK